MSSSSSPGANQLPSDVAAIVNNVLPIFAARHNRDKFKTEMCRNFSQTGICRYGDKCQFAHGLQDLRARRLPLQYKTRICRTYSQSGHCPYGNKCRFIHGNENDLMALQLHEELVAIGLTPEQATVALPWAAQISELAEKQLMAAAAAAQFASPPLPPLPPGQPPLPALPPGQPPLPPSHGLALPSNRPPLPPGVQPPLPPGAPPPLHLGIQHLNLGLPSGQMPPLPPQPPLPPPHASSQPPLPPRPHPFAQQPPLPLSHGVSPLLQSAMPPSQPLSSVLLPQPAADDVFGQKLSASEQSAYVALLLAGGMSGERSSSTLGNLPPTYSSASLADSIISSAATRDGRSSTERCASPMLRPHAACGEAVPANLLLSPDSLDIGEFLARDLASLFDDNDSCA